MKSPGQAAYEYWNVGPWSTVTPETKQQWELSANAAISNAVNGDLDMYLLPIDGCPHCGMKPQIVDPAAFLRGVSFCIECVTCNCRMNSFAAENPNELIGRWNKRKGR